MSEDNRQNGDGKFTVVQNGQRVGTQDHTNQQDAVTEADEMRKRQQAIQEGGNQPAPAVKQNLFG